jgi:hypothetical protein
MVCALPREQDQREALPSPPGGLCVTHLEHSVVVRDGHQLTAPTRSAYTLPAPPTASVLGHSMILIRYVAIGSGQKRRRRGRRSVPASRAFPRSTPRACEPSPSPVTSSCTRRWPSSRETAACSADGGCSPLCFPGRTRSSPSIASPCRTTLAATTDNGSARGERGAAMTPSLRQLHPVRELRGDCVTSGACDHRGLGRDILRFDPLANVSPSTRPSAATRDDWMNGGTYMGTLSPRKGQERRQLPEHSPGRRVRRLRGRLGSETLHRERP